jgi:hypothetical protein
MYRTSGPLTEGLGPTSHLGSLPAPRVACRCSPVVLTDNTFWHAQWDIIDYIDYFNNYFIDYIGCFLRLHHL